MSWTWSSTFVFSSFISNLHVGASFSLIICPSNWNLICLIDKLCYSHEVFYSFRSPGFLFIFNGTTFPASFKWICSLSPGFCIIHGKHWRALGCWVIKEAPGLHWTQAVQGAVEEKGELLRLLRLWGKPVSLHKDPLRNFSWVSDLEKLSAPKQLFWLLEAPGLGSRPPSLLQRDLTQHYPPKELKWSLYMHSVIALPHWPPCFHTGPCTM